MGLRTDIVNTLNGPLCGQIKFHLAGIGIEGSDYRTIAGHVRSGAVQVVQSTILPSYTAAYNRRYNALIVGSAPRPNLVVHEATHAIQDLRGKATSGAMDEALAYVAQTMFVWLSSNNWNTRTRPSVSGPMMQSVQQCEAGVSSCSNATIMAAAMISLDLLHSQFPKVADLQRLYSCLHRDPQYRSALHQHRRFDGIERKGLPPGELRRLQATVVDT